MGESLSDWTTSPLARRVRHYAGRVRYELAARLRRAHTRDFVARRIVARYLETASPAALNLGCGVHPMRGWLNIDFDGNGQIVRDLTEGLPYIPSASFDFAFSEHFLEHIERRDALRLLRDLRRVLKSGGRLRLAIPDLEMVVAKYLDGSWKNPDDDLHVQSFADHYGEILQTRGEWFDMAMRGWGHRYLYSFEDLVKVLGLAGFREIVRKPHGGSDVAFLRGLETRAPDASALVVEAVAP